MWTAVFKTGTHTDANGNIRLWTENDLDRIAASYDPARHEAPVVIGHPLENAPAWGWVKGLKRKGGLLLARLKLAPEFEEMLGKGLFKKRSISLYPDMTLRHIGFLGAMPPAVKGLPECAFEEAHALSIETYHEGKEASGMNQLIEKLRRLLTDELAGTEPLRENRDALRRKEADLRRHEIAAFCEGLAREGRLTPAMLKRGLPGFMEMVSQLEGSFDFSARSSPERGENQKDPSGMSPLEFFKGFLSGLPRCVHYGEHAPPEGSPEEQRKRLIEEHLEAKKAGSYRDVLIRVSKEHPELF